MRGLFLHAEWQSFWSFFVGESSPANLCLSFFNTEDTEFTEHHSAHLDRTEAASRQLMTRKLRTHITSLQAPRLCVPHRASLSRPTGEGWGGAPISPAPRRRAGEGPQFFFNTEDTEFTEYHSAHLDRTEAASRQLMTRNLRTHITSLLNSASSHRASLSRPTGEGWGGAPISPAPRRRAGEGPQFFFNTEDTEFTENPPAHFDNTDHRVAMDG